VTLKSETHHSLTSDMTVLACDRRLPEGSSRHDFWGLAEREATRSRGWLKRREHWSNYGDWGFRSSAQGPDGGCRTNRSPAFAMTLQSYNIGTISVEAHAGC